MVTFFSLERLLFSLEHVYQDLSTGTMIGLLKNHCQFANHYWKFIEPIGAQIKDLGTASQMLLTTVKLHL